MPTIHQAQQVADLTEQYVREHGNDAHWTGGDSSDHHVNGGSPGSDYIRIDFDNPVNVDTGHMSAHLGMDVELSDDGRSITYHSPR